MCYIPSCTAASAFGAPFVAGACDTHFKKLKADLAARFPALASEPLCNDVALSYVLMSDEAAVLGQLDELNADLSGIDPAKVRLSAALEYYELLCWFPRVRVMPTAVLSGDEFLDLIAHGCVLKDVGAGAPHGRLTHRLQWHALMRAMTGGFAGASMPPWRGTPLQLYCRLGRSDTLGPTGGSIWGTVFDLGGSPPGVGFRAPDRLHAALLASSALAIQMNQSRKRDEDARNLALAVAEHLRQAAAGNGPLAGRLARPAATALQLGFGGRFGADKAFTYEELYAYLDADVYGGTTTDGYPNAYLYIVHNGTPTATAQFLQQRGLPTDLKVLAKPSLGPPDDDTINGRVTASLSGLNHDEVAAIDWGGFVKGGL